MTEPPAPTAAPLRNPSAALERRFAAIWHGPMAGLPMVNAQLRVQAVGFRPWGPHWLGVLVTPWFMNLVLMPRELLQWVPLAERESRFHAFPAGVFEFIGGHDEEIGAYQACSLFSPMFEFNSPEQAAATGLAALQALFDAANLPVDLPTALPELPKPAEASAEAAALAATATRPPLSKRDFLFGGHGPRPETTADGARRR